MWPVQRAVVVQAWPGAHDTRLLCRAPHARPAPVTNRRLNPPPCAFGVRVECDAPCPSARASIGAGARGALLRVHYWATCVAMDLGATRATMASWSCARKRKMSEVWRAVAPEFCAQERQRNVSLRKKGVPEFQEFLYSDLLPD